MLSTVMSLITLLTKLFLFLLAAGFLGGAVLAPTPWETPGSYFPRVSMCVALKQQHEYVKIHRAVDLAKMFTTRMTI